MCPTRGSPQHPCTMLRGQPFRGSPRGVMPALTLPLPALPPTLPVLGTLLSQVRCKASHYTIKLHMPFTLPSIAKHLVFDGCIKDEDLLYSGKPSHTSQAYMAYYVRVLSYKMFVLVHQKTNAWPCAITSSEISVANSVLVLKHNTLDRQDLPSIYLAHHDLGSVQNHNANGL